MEEDKTESAVGTRDEKQRSQIRKAFLLGTGLIVLDALILNQGAIAFFVAVAFLFVGLPRALFAKGERRHRLARVAVFLVAATSVFALNFANNALAKSRANDLVAAVEAFHGKYSRYPDRLQDLVPEFVDAVPLAKYTLTFNAYAYWPGEHAPMLFYLDFPPFGRPIYDFSRAQWQYLD